MNNFPAFPVLCLGFDHNFSVLKHVYHKSWPPTFFDLPTPLASSMAMSPRQNSKSSVILEWFHAFHIASPTVGRHNVLCASFRYKWQQEAVYGHERLTKRLYSTAKWRLVTWFSRTSLIRSPLPSNAEESTFRHWNLVHVFLNANLKDTVRPPALQYRVTFSRS